MTVRIQENQLKALFFIILFIVLGIQALMAQPSQRGHAPVYRGFFTSFGTRAVNVSSDIAKIDGTNLMETGGQVGLIFGTRIVRSKIGLLGYYSSTGSTAGTTDLYASNVSANIYPLSMLSGRRFLIEPYLTGGVAYDRFKFFGYYVNREPGVVNYSRGEAPFLGKIKQINAMAGAGIEVKLRDDYSFIHLFSEVRFGRNLSAKATDVAFERTSLKDQMHVAVGISFGAR
ncbi:MAG TPA: hypothetical protein VF490_06190 [Chryseosolibacter sp.]